jgi:hypothetical protein
MSREITINNIILQPIGPNGDQFNVYLFEDYVGYIGLVNGLFSVLDDFYEDIYTYQIKPTPSKEEKEKYVKEAKEYLLLNSIWLTM